MTKEGKGSSTLQNLPQRLVSLSFLMVYVLIIFKLYKLKSMFTRQKQVTPEGLGMVQNSMITIQP